MYLNKNVRWWFAVAVMYRALDEEGARSFLIPIAFAVGTRRGLLQLVYRARPIEGSMLSLAATQVRAHAPDGPGDAARRIAAAGDEVVDSWAGWRWTSATAVCGPGGELVVGGASRALLPPLTAGGWGGGASAGGDWKVPTVSGQ